MKLNHAQAEYVEELMGSYLGEVLTQIISDRIESRQRRLVTGKLTHEEYIAVAAAIRELEYLLAEPLSLVRKADRA